jgi:ACT domain-containing protein
MKHCKQNSLYTYLETTGVLTHGDDEAILQARKKYWKEYKREWRKNKRKQEKEITTSWKKDELKDLIHAVKLHNTSRSAFIKAATIAYVNKTYIVRDRMEVQRIAQLLALNYNCILEMTEEHTLTQKDIKPLLEKINSLEHTILSSLHNPKTLDQLVAEAVSTNPHQKSYLLKLIQSLS